MEYGVNQQETHSDLAWLCGFLDGEGSFTFHRRAPWQDQRQTTYQPEVVFTNTHIASLERVSEILAKYGIGSYITKPNPTNIRKHPEWKPARRVLVLGFKRVKKLLDICLPFIFTKREQARVVLEFIILREAKNTRDVYGVEEQVLIEKLHTLNQRGSSETLRVPSQEDDKVQT